VPCGPRGHGAVEVHSRIDVRLGSLLGQEKERTEIGHRAVVLRFGQPLRRRMAHARSCVSLEMSRAATGRKTRLSLVRPQVPEAPPSPGDGKDERVLRPSPTLLDGAELDHGVVGIRAARAAQKPCPPTENRNGCEWGILGSGRAERQRPELPAVTGSARNAPWIEMTEQERGGGTQM